MANNLIYAEYILLETQQQSNLMLREPLQTS